MKSLQESREQFKQKVFSLVDEGRQAYKQKLSETIAERNKYREMISSRKEKERALTEILA
jgi:hypothetical protein